METAAARPRIRVPPGSPGPEPVASPPSPIALRVRTEQDASDPGRIARARRSAAELETRARREFDRAREQHVTVRLAVQAFESDRRRAGGLLAGGLAYRIFLWQIPLALFLVSAFGLATELSGDDPADLARKTGMTAALAGAISQAVAASAERSVVAPDPRRVPHGLGGAGRVPRGSVGERAGVGDRALPAGAR